VGHQFPMRVSQDFGRNLSYLATGVTCGIAHVNL
jgi:hypothetical protein